jgi:hypothetical protein
MADDYRDVPADETGSDVAFDLSCTPIDAPAAAFDAIPARGRRFGCRVPDSFFAGPRRERYREVSNPGANRSDNHLQGIQRYHDRLYLSAGDLMEGCAHLFVLHCAPDDDGDTSTELVRIISLDERRDHGGGMQRLGDVLAVAIEGAGGIGSTVTFLHLRDPDRPRVISGARIDREEVKASAVALARQPCAAGDRILAAVTWVRSGRFFGLLGRSRAYLDLYLSRSADLRDGFLPDAVRLDVTKLTDRLPAWQSIGFLPPADPCELALIGTLSSSSTPGGRALADLCRLRLDADPADSWPAVRVTAEHVHTRTFEFERDHGDFAAAAGVDCDANGAIALYAGGHFRHADGFRLSVCAPADYDPQGSPGHRPSR